MNKSKLCFHASPHVLFLFRRQNRERCGKLGRPGITYHVNESEEYDVGHGGERARDYKFVHNKTGSMFLTG